jgi:acetyltransferase-like isoleucine patch superfamily enzyme
LIFVKIKLDNSNDLKSNSSKIINSHFRISGNNNSVLVNKAYISKSIISISGKNNKLIIEPDVMLRSSNVQIRGSNCIVQIGKGTTFGGVRIVNVGKNNNITIGENCLFADYIELWASDTHSIYDADGNFINMERPVKIENHVWVGSHVKILKGVTVGSGAVIGMNTLVTKNIDPKTLNIGIPSKCIKENISWELNYENE